MLQLKHDASGKKSRLSCCKCHLDSIEANLANLQPENLQNAWKAPGVKGLIAPKKHISVSYPTLLESPQHYDMTLHVSENNYKCLYENVTVQNMEKNWIKTTYMYYKIFCVLLLSSHHFGTISKQISATFSFIAFLGNNFMQSNNWKCVKLSWQSVFFLKFSRGYEERCFSLKGNGKRNGHGLLSTWPCCPCLAFFPTRPRPYGPSAFVMVYTCHLSDP